MHFFHSYLSIFLHIFLFTHNTIFPLLSILNALTWKSMSICSQKINFILGGLIFWFFILLAVILSNRSLCLQDYSEPEIIEFVSLFFQLCLTSYLASSYTVAWVIRKIKLIHCWETPPLSFHFPKPKVCDKLYSMSSQ